MSKLKYLFLLLVSLNFLGCELKETNDGEFLIVTTTAMLADIAKSIVVDKGRVVSLMGPGVDPHLFKTSQGDLRLLKKADVIIYNGLHLEGKMIEVIEKLDRFPNKVVVAAAESINDSNLILIDGDGSNYDPHIWFDVLLFSETINPILGALTMASPSYTNEFKKNAALKKQQLISLDKWAKKELSMIPTDQRKLITAHDAFSYFGRAYDIDVKGLQGISTISEAGIKDITTLVNQLVEEQIKAIFVENSVPKKYVEAVIAGAERKGHNVVIGGTLYSDAMGEKDTPEGTYQGMVQHNINTIVNALK